MKKFLLSLILALGCSSAMAQTPQSNSVTLNWTNPAAYQSGLPLTIAQVSIIMDNSQIAQSGVVTTFTTTALPAGPHTFYVSLCDGMVPANCSLPSNTVTVTVPATPMVVPSISNLTAVVNP